MASPGSTSSAGPVAAITVDAVSKRYGAVPALSDVSLEVPRGEVYCLLGPNGSGKSTLMRMLAGSLLPSSGRLAVSGFDVFKNRMLARRRIGYVPESIPLYDSMRVGDFLRFMARLHHVPTVEVGDAAERTMERLAIQDVAKRPIRQLSRGYRQRVALAQALLHEPDVLILDEPTNGLDPRQIIDLRSLLHSLAGQHTILMSSHILSEVERTAQRVAILVRGRLLGIRLISETPDLEDWFLSLT